MTEQKSLRQQWTELNPVMKGVGIAVAVLAVLTLMFGPSSVDSPSSSAKPAGPSLRIGQDYELSVGGGDILAATSEPAFDEVMTALLAKDSARYLGLMREGKAIDVDGGTKVRLLGGSWTKKQVSIQSGPHHGKAIWVPREFIR